AALQLLPLHRQGNIEQHDNRLRWNRNRSSARLSSNRRGVSRAEQRLHCKKAGLVSPPNRSRLRRRWLPAFWIAAGQDLQRVAPGGVQIVSRNEIVGQVDVARLKVPAYGVR